MSAPSPASTPVRGGVHQHVSSRLPWWGLVLPILAFVILLALMAEPAQAQPPGGQSAVGPLLDSLRFLLSH
ncbi:hypothetical protein [Streptomyces sp. NPDC047315]|uniref:hypothetical protein n=1 Tax=Streptomyces sp. NPDC047315 TaxID=3155142 RepID=UPI0033C01BF0